MEVVIVDDKFIGAQLVAGCVADIVNDRAHATIGFATGSSLRPVYAELLSLFTAGQLNASSLRGFLLDEYVGLAADDPRLYRAEIRSNVFEKLKLPVAALSGPDVDALDLYDACTSYEETIRNTGGIALQLLGIGSNGHIGFNEPSSSLSSRTRVKTLSDATRCDNARFFGGEPAQVPHLVVTQGIGTIRDADHIILVAWGENKSEAIARCVEGPVTSMVPASALQLHPHVTVVIDNDAASKLTMAEYFRQSFSAKPAWQHL